MASVQVDGLATEEAWVATVNVAWFATVLSAVYWAHLTVGLVAVYATYLTARFATDWKRA